MANSLGVALRKKMGIAVEPWRQELADARAQRHGAVGTAQAEAAERLSNARAARNEAKRDARARANAANRQFYGPTGLVYPQSGPQGAWQPNPTPNRPSLPQMPVIDTSTIDDEIALQDAANNERVWGMGAQDLGVSGIGSPALSAPQGGLMGSRPNLGPEITSNRDWRRLRRVGIVDRDTARAGIQANRSAIRDYQTMIDNAYYDMDRRPFTADENARRIDALTTLQKMYRRG